MKDQSPGVAMVLQQDNSWMIQASSDFQRWWQVEEQHLRMPWVGSGHLPQLLLTWPVGSCGILCVCLSKGRMQLGPEAGLHPI